MRLKVELASVKTRAGNWSSITRPPTTKSSFASSPAPCIINWYQTCLITLPPRRRRRRNWQFAVNPDSLSRQRQCLVAVAAAVPVEGHTVRGNPPGYFLLNERICQTCVAFLVIVLKVYRPDGRSAWPRTQGKHVYDIKDLSLKN